MLTRGWLDASKITVGLAYYPVQVVIVAINNGKPLVKHLVLPLPKNMIEHHGVHSSDIIIRQALAMAFADLRAKPWKLQAAFRSLLTDVETAEIYGEKLRRKAVAWFMENDVPVVMNTIRQSMNANYVAVTLLESTEAEVTLGDVHHEPFEATDSEWPVLVGPFDAFYDPDTGEFDVPESAGRPFASMILVDSANRPYPILDVAGQTVTLDPGLVLDLRQATLRAGLPNVIRPVESGSFREAYAVDVHAHGDPIHLTWLHSIVVFSLLHYRQFLLEARGFERSSISSGEFRQDNQTSAEATWARTIQVTGFVRHSWPKEGAERTLGADPNLRILQPGSAVNTFSPEPDQSEEAQYLAQDGAGA